MKKTTTTDNQIMAALKRVEARLPVPEICWEPGISTSAFYKLEGPNLLVWIHQRWRLWRSTKRNLRPRSSTIISQKVSRPSRRRGSVKKVFEEFSLPIRLASAVLSVSEYAYHYDSKQNAENGQIADSLVRLADKHRNWGFGLCYLYLRNIKGFG